SVVVRDLIDLGVALAVAPDVRESVWRLRVRPEVRRLAHVVVLVAARRRGRLARDRERARAQGLSRVRLQLAQRRVERLVAREDGALSLRQPSRVNQEDARRATLNNPGRHILTRRD